MKHFITGGAGFIGSHLVDALGNEEIVVYDNLSSGRLEYLKPHLGKERFVFIKGDLLDFDTLKDCLKDCDVLWHLAANPDIRKGTKNTRLDLEQNTLATYNVLEAMRKNDVEKIVFSSSSAIYGIPTTQPVKEDYGPLVPISLYGASKLACEGLITAFSHLYGIKAWIFRFANVIGPRLTHGVIYDFIRKLKRNKSTLEILGNGEQRKSYIHVSDCIDAMLFAFKHAKENVNIFNISTNDSCSVKRIAEIVCEVMNVKPKFVFTGGRQGWRGDVPHIVLDATKLNKLGWKAKLCSEEAVRKAVEENVL